MNIKDFIKNLFIYKPKNDYNFILPETNNTDNSISNIHELSYSQNIYSDINLNLEYMKVKYNSLINSDINIREFALIARDKQYSAFLIYIDGMVESKTINDFILEPLMLRNRANTFDIKGSKYSNTTNNVQFRKIKKFNLEDYIFQCLIPQNSIKKSEKFDEIIDDINSGNCIIFVDTLNIAFSAETKGFKQRSIDSPSNEIVIRGSQEAFVEAIRTNTSLLRRIVNNKNLIIENASVGKISKTKVAICYMSNIVSDDLVAEVKYRINNLDVDYVLSSGQLEQLIQDDGNTIFPQILATERPDKTSAHLLEGRVAILINGSPYALVVPGILTDFLASPEDANLNFYFANLLKFIRFLAVFLALLLPGLYVAITNFHQELIPTELLFAIASSRESIPFPIIIEILIMEIAFELIREAGLRVPSPIGPTISIVGALILGEAAVSANIVSPILIIIVAITGICSFAIPDFSLNFALRILRFLYIFLGYMAGFLGIGLGLFIQSVLLSQLKSFGAPYISPYFSENSYKSTNSYFIKPIWKREKKYSFLNTKRPASQGYISMLWKKTKGNGE